MLTTVIKEGTGVHLQNRQTWCIDQNVIDDFANSFQASNDLVHAAVVPFEMLLIPNAARLHTYRPNGVIKQVRGRDSA